MSHGYIPAALPESGDANAVWFIHACGFIANGRINQPPTAACILCSTDVSGAPQDGWSLLFREVRWSDGDPNLPLATRVEAVARRLVHLIDEAHAADVACPVPDCAVCGGLGHSFG